VANTSMQRRRPLTSLCLLALQSLLNGKGARATCSRNLSGRRRHISDGTGEPAPSLAQAVATHLHQVLPA
jgi:hypothetical protein